MRMLHMDEIENFELLKIILGVNAEHIRLYEIASNVVCDDMINMQFSELSIQLFVKMPKVSQKESLAMRSFQKKVAFYNVFGKYFIYILPQCYMAKMKYYSIEQPVIVLKDLTTRDYNQIDSKLNAMYLEKYVEGIAYCHANMMKIQKENPEYFNYFLEIYSPEDKNHEIIRQERTASAFLKNPVTQDTLSDILRAQIKSKLNKVKYLQTSTISTLIHDSCTHSNVFFKVENNVFYIKFIDFQMIQLGTPVIDFGRILLINLPNGNDIEYLQLFCIHMLSIYTTRLKELYPLMNVTYILF